MKRSNFEKRLNGVLKEEEHYVLNILLLSYLTDDEEYKNIAELCFMFNDYSNFKDFIKYYGGKTIKIPTQRELRMALRHLLLFQYVKIDNKNFDDAFTSSKLADYGVDKKSAKATIDKFYNYLKENEGNPFPYKNKLFKLF